MASDNELWTPINQDELKKWRRDLPKGSVRETNTAYYTGLEPAESDGDTAFLESSSSDGTVPLAQTAPPREVAEDIFGLMWLWAQQNPQNYALMAQMVRHNNPAAFGHLSDDELKTKLEQHAKDAGRKATEDVYKERSWDRGNDLDMMQGKPVTP